MPKKSKSGVLRQLAEKVVRQLFGEGESWKQEQAELVTSLVRQWITYDGNATLFRGEQQLHFTLSHSPLGQPTTVPVVVQSNWLKRVAEQRKIRPEDLPDVLDQLNRGQSAEVTSAEGIPLRFWVNPKERRGAIESPANKPLPSAWKGDYLKPAFEILDGRFGALLDAAEKEKLAGSLARQWQRYQGRACLFIGTERFDFTLTEREVGESSVSVTSIRTDFEAALCSFGLPPEDLPEAVARINLDQEIQFRNKQGTLSRLWHNPRTKQICARPVETAPAARRRRTPPLFCPRCSAVLRLWQAGERQQVCPCCGNTISLGE